MDQRAPAPDGAGAQRSGDGEGVVALAQEDFSGLDVAVREVLRHPQAEYPRRRLSAALIEDGGHRPDLVQHARVVEDVQPVDALAFVARDHDRGQRRGHDRRQADRGRERAVGARAHEALEEQGAAQAAHRVRLDREGLDRLRGQGRHEARIRYHVDGRRPEPVGAVEPDRRSRGAGSCRESWIGARQQRLAVGQKADRHRRGCSGRLTGEPQIIGVGGRAAADAGRAVPLEHEDAGRVVVQDLDRHAGASGAAEQWVERVDLVDDLGDQSPLADSVVDGPHVHRLRDVPVRRREHQRAQRVAGAIRQRDLPVMGERDRHGRAGAGRPGQRDVIGVLDALPGRRGQAALEHQRRVAGLRDREAGLVVVLHRDPHVADGDVVEARVGAPAAVADHHQPLALLHRVLDGSDVDRLRRIPGARIEPEHRGA